MAFLFTLLSTLLLLLRLGKRDVDRPQKHRGYKIDFGDGT